jgi:hypothetical protein
LLGTNQTCSSHCFKPHFLVSNHHTIACHHASLESTPSNTMSIQVQQPTECTEITKPLTANIEANRPSYLVTNTSERTSEHGHPPSQIPSLSETLQNVVQSSDNLPEGNTLSNEPGPKIPFPISNTSTFMCLENILHISAMGKSPFLPKTNYLPLTAHSPVHMGIGEKTLAWIIMHLGIIR